MLNGTDLKYGYTGGPATMVDSEKAFAKSEMLIGVGTIVVILVLMLVIFRSPLAALLPIITVGVVSMVAPPVIALVAKATGLEVDQSLQGILIVVLFGIGTDYILFLFFRYRERLRMGDDKKEAMIIAVERVGEAIVSAAGAVVIAFSAMILASLGMFRAMGPALAIAVVVMAIAGLTLVPAVVSLIGPKVFWPSKSWQSMPQGTTFQKIGNVVGGKPAVSALVSGLVMVALAAGALSFKADYSAIGETPSGTESSRAADDMNSAFPKGMMGPTQVYVKSTDGKPLDQTAVDAFAQSFKGGAKGVAQVSPTDPTAPQPKYAKYSDSGTAAEINLVLDTDPFGLDALGLIDPMRDFADAKAPPNTDVMVGGMSAIFADMRTATDRDMSVIFPVAAILIALVLGLLLRSVVAPWYLMIAVALGYAGTLGAAVLVFQTIQGEPGVMFMLPMMIYMFVVAIGTDYNILMVARLREEAKEGHPPRKAAALAVEHAGPSVAAAGVILAGSFATLLLSSVGMMKQMGFAVAVGVCLSAFVMSMFLVPALTALIGKKAWYPGHGADARVTPDADVDREPQLAGKN
jgi:RND superfamily putative drug exporter